MATEGTTQETVATEGVGTVEVEGAVEARGAVGAGATAEGEAAAEGALEAGASGQAKTAPTPVAAAGTSGRAAKPAWTGATEGDPTSTVTTVAPETVTEAVTGGSAAAVVSVAAAGEVPGGQAEDEARTRTSPRLGEVITRAEAPGEAAAAAEAGGASTTVNTTASGTAAAAAATTTSATAAGALETPVSDPSLPRPHPLKLPIAGLVTNNFFPLIGSFAIKTQ